MKKLTRSKKIKDLQITPIPTHHSLKVASQAYLIKKGKEKILYTGDIIWMNKEHQRKLGQLDLVITEASYWREGGMIRRDPVTGKLFGHTGVPNIMKLFSKFTKAILFMHFGAWFFEDMKTAKKKLIQLGKEQGVKVIVGYDGMEMDSQKLIDK